MAKMSPQELLRFAYNDRQVEVIQSVINHGSNNKAAKALGCGRETMEGFEAKRVSTA